VLLRLQGVAAEAEQIRHRLGTTKIGAPEMFRCAKDLGLKARVYRTDWSRFTRAPLPGIAVLRDGGFHAVRHKIRLSRQSIRQRNDFVRAHRVLTAAATMAGQDDSAKLALRVLRRAQPNISLAWISSQLPIKREADLDHYLEAFGRAGGMPPQNCDRKIAAT
jgi:hypothetical protein